MTFAGAAGALETLGGIRILPDQVAASWPAEQLLPAIGGRQPAKALDDALRGIASRYGTGTANVVAMQLEYPRGKERRDADAAGAIGAADEERRREVAAK